MEVRPPNRFKLVAAFAAIYVLWGSTYLAIRIAVETLPPLLMAGVRFLIAGAILYAVSSRTGSPRPTPRQWRNAAVASVFFFVVGNGGASWAEQTVPSGAASLVIATLPAWLLLLDWGYGGRTPPRWTEVAGLVMGLAGVATLSAPGGIDPVGAAVLLVAAVAWAVGSLLNRYSDLPASPLRSTGMQMLAGGAVLVVAGTLLGEVREFDPTDVPFVAYALVGYLVLVALVALPAYNWLLSVISPALVGTYAFVNPVIAVLLGWAIAGEELNERTALAGVLVVLAVMLLVWPRKKVDGKDARLA
jgi:drug/metabolite transporter (DMT)-like permease